MEEAIRLAVPLPVISAALFARFDSRQDDSPAMKAVAALRNQFGGHAVKEAVGAAKPGRGRRARCTSGGSSWSTSGPTRQAELDSTGAERAGRAERDGKTNLIEAMGYVATLGSAPGRHRPAAGPGRCRAGRHRGARCCTTSGS